MTSQEIASPATLISNPVFPDKSKDTSAKKVFIKEYLKSFIFLAAIYALIINQAKHDKTEVAVSMKNTMLRANNFEKKSGNEYSLLSLINSGTSIIFYPRFIIWK